MSVKKTVDQVKRSLAAATPGPLRGSGSLPSMTIVIGSFVATALVAVAGFNLAKQETVSRVATPARLGTIPQAPPPGENGPRQVTVGAGETLSRQVSPDVFRTQEPLPTADFHDARPLPLPADPVDVPSVSRGASPVPPAPLDTQALAGPAGARPAPSAPLVVAAAPPPPVAPPPIAQRTALQVDSNSCDQPAIAVEPLEGGFMILRVNSKCRAGEDVKVLYGSTALRGHLDGYGATEMALDLYLGPTKSATIVFADGTRRVLPVVASDFSQLSKVAIVWRTPVNLDLHVFEYETVFERASHVWASAPSSYSAATAAVTATKRGHGFISTMADGTASGDQIEIYTFVHSDQQLPGAVTMSLDYQNRGATRGPVPLAQTCGTGTYAKVEYEVFTLSRQGQVTSGRGTIRPVDCNAPVSTLLRFEKGGLPTLNFRP